MTSNATSLPIAAPISSDTPTVTPPFDTKATSFCAIDFGTSNSAVAVCEDGVSRLVPLEGEAFNLPSAIFYPAERDEPPLIGRAAMKAYLDQEDGRLLRALKSVLGSSLMTANTEVGPGRVMSFTAIMADYLRRIRARAQATCREPLDRVLMGRPAYFVDDDPARDAQAQASLAEAAQLAGFREVAFELEPVAASLTYARNTAPTRAQIALVADIGGGTSDFSVIRMAAGQSTVLSNHGVHLAGTDFDRRVSLAQVMPLLGFGAMNASGRPVPGAIFHDLATWHRVNSLYTQKSRSALVTHRDLYGGPIFYRRLSRLLDLRLGHQCLALAEEAKIQAPSLGRWTLDLSELEAQLEQTITAEHVLAAIGGDLANIVRTAQSTIERAGLDPTQVDAIFFTGGSSGLQALRQAIAALTPNATVVEGERFDSVAYGLGLAALARWSSL